MCSSSLSKTLFLIIPVLFVFSSINAWSYFLQDDPLRKAATRESAAKVTQGFTLLTAESLQSLLSSNPGENLFFSAFSLSTALSMAAEGARGETQKEMISTLHLPEDPTSISPAFYQILKGSGLFQQHDQLQLSVANKLWIDQRFSVEPGFSQASKQSFLAGAELCNFGGAPDQERKKINRWAEIETKGKIKDLIPPEAITPLTRMVLTNAIYFKATWARAFDKARTTQKRFTLLSNEEIFVPMMTEKAKLRFTQQDTFKALEKPYFSPEGKDLSMIFILPEEEGIKGLQATLNALRPTQGGNIPSLSQMLPTEITVWIPKFKLEFEFEASKLLQKLGMKKAFSEAGADFSGISHEQTFISAVFHKAFVEVNEEGTEAAAAAAAIIMTKSLVIDARTFVANRPFLFLIWDRTSKVVLFSGLVADPSQ